MARKRPSKYTDFSPEMLEKRAARRIKRERKLQAEQRSIIAERTGVVGSALQLHGNCGLLAVQGATVDKFMRGFADDMHKRLLLLPAKGNIQGTERDSNSVKTTLREIEDHRRQFGRTGILGFVGADFAGQSGRGTPLIAEQAASMLVAAHEAPDEEPAVVVFGIGQPEDLPTSRHYDHHRDRGFVSELDIVLGLDLRGEPRAILEKTTFIGTDTQPRYRYGQLGHIIGGVNPAPEDHRPRPEQA